MGSALFQSFLRKEGDGLIGLACLQLKPPHVKIVLRANEHEGLGGEAEKVYKEIHRAQRVCPLQTHARARCRASLFLQGRKAGAFFSQLVLHVRTRCHERIQIKSGIWVLSR